MVPGHHGGEGGVWSHRQGVAPICPLTCPVTVDKDSSLTLSFPGPRLLLAAGLGDDACKVLIQGPGMEPVYTAGSCLYDNDLVHDVLLASGKPLQLAGV